MLVVNKFHRVGVTAKLFDGLGKSLGSDSQPFAITTLRRVSSPLLKTVIRKVENPTDRCTGMVVVAKSKSVPKEGDKMQKQKVRICVDLTKLNEIVQRNTICPQSTRH